ncbi:MAG: ABC transporter ATP-binding protein [Clostridiaceae bacterium]|nr:ABC transporter ATP-binding protein [Clostridiaceae bacterium]
MLKVTNLTKSYGSLEVLKGISFEIKRGKVYGFLGQNGAGKTTTMNILTGLIDFNGGDIVYEDKDFKNDKRQILKKVGYLPQNPVFYGYMTGNEYLNFIGTLTNMSLPDIKKRTNELLEVVGLKDAGKRRLSGYSGGMKQRFGFAVSLFNKPELLFLDEPTSALDPEGRMEILDFINDLKNQGVTVFLSTHILNDIERVCDEVSIIKDGKIIVSAGLEELKNNYIQPIYDLEFENDCTKFKNILTNLNWVEDLQLNKNKLSVHVKNISLARSELLKLLVVESNPLMVFNLRKSTLEEIFLRLVNKDVLI